MKITLISLLNIWLSASSSYMHKLALREKSSKLFTYLFAIHVGFRDLLVKREYGIFAGYIRYAKGLIKSKA